VPKFAQHFQVLKQKDATNEAIRDWINPVDTYYIIGSVVGPHPYPDMVARFQSVVSEEIKTIIRKEGREIRLSNRLRGWRQ
jgi:tryptophan synthase beta subunit